MIVSVVSMPEGVVARAALPEARERLAAPDFVIVDVDEGDDPRPTSSHSPACWDWMTRRGIGSAGSTSRYGPTTTQELSRVSCR